ncbi:MAG TPA: hypothetical protein VMO20_08615 [Candidatus Acidoferrum sp.]|nr:hypothetical protein [Candidatus Acidoferrum sp.]
MSVPPKLPLTLDRAWAYVLLNISVPGWGSWKGGRKIAGFGEMFLFAVCLILLGIWFLDWMNRMIQSEIGDTLPPVPANWLWQCGLGLYVVSLIWTIATGVSLIREARAYEAEVRRNTPPKLEDLPKPPKLS